MQAQEEYLQKITISVNEMLASVSQYFKQKTIAAKKENDAKMRESNAQLDIMRSSIQINENASNLDTLMTLANILSMGSGDEGIRMRRLLTEDESLEYKAKMQQIVKRLV